MHVIREAHSSCVSGNFGGGKIVALLQRYCYWPRMNETIHKFKMHHDKQRNVHTSKHGDVEYLRVGLKGMNPSKLIWMEIGRVRELYPHLMYA